MYKNAKNHKNEKTMYCEARVILKPHHTRSHNVPGTGTLQGTSESLLGTENM